MRATAGCCFAMCALLSAGRALGGSTAGTIDWPALDPSFSGATYVNDTAVCAACHQDYITAYERTRHARAFRFGETPAAGDCESCHGPRSNHVENPSVGRPYDEWPADRQSAVCMQCHAGGGQLGWKGGAHKAADVSCSSCHLVMERQSDRGLLIREDTTQACYSCHADVRAAMNKTSHHPVREGRMDCASCHDVHGASTPALLRGNTVNETCYACHADKRGPFLWEHPPVRENCLNCHESHGSNHRNMLVSKDPFLCLQCHSYGGHINLPRYNRVSSSYGSGCVNCHTTTHGSNHPSGAKQVR